MEGLEDYNNVEEPVYASDLGVETSNSGMAGVED